MTYETAFEVDTIIASVEAAVDTLTVVHSHFCDDGTPLSNAQVQKFSNTLWTVERMLNALVEKYQEQINAAIEARKKENKQA